MSGAGRRLPRQQHLPHSQLRRPHRGGVQGALQGPGELQILHLRHRDQLVLLEDCQEPPSTVGPVRQDEVYLWQWQS